MKNQSSVLTGAVFGLIVGGIYFVLKCLNGAVLSETVSQAIITAVLTAVIFGLYIHSFAKKQAKEFEPVRERMSAECQIIREAAANHLYSGESVGGWLFLTRGRLYFKSQTMNIYSHTCTVYLDEIESVKLIKLLNMVANGFEVINEDGTRHRFTVSNPKKWIENIEKLR